MEDKTYWNPKLSDEENRLIDEALPFVTSNLHGKTLSGEPYTADLNASVYIPMSAVNTGGVVQFIYHDSDRLSCKPEIIEICQNGHCIESSPLEMFKLLSNR